MLYFAYGSNMDLDQMKSRCPSARFYGVAELRDHQLAFTRKSRKRGCGVADVITAKGKSVWGVVYEISEQDIDYLDRAEGYQPGRQSNAYLREERVVFLNGNEQSPLSVAIYIANKEKNPPLPNQEYKDLLIKGARFWRLPEDYIKNTLETIKVSVK